MVHKSPHAANWENLCDNDVTCFDIAVYVKGDKWKCQPCRRFEWEDMGLTWSLETGIAESVRNL